MGSAAEADDAIERVNRSELDGRIINVEKVPHSRLRSLAPTAFRVASKGREGKSAVLTGRMRMHQKILHNNTNPSTTTPTPSLLKCKCKQILQPSPATS
jgi:hypothetical protein